MVATKKKRQFWGVFYIASCENFASILKHGVLSHNRAMEIDRRSVYDKGIVGKRRDKTAPNGKSLWDFANFYFQPRNAMMYRVRQIERQNIVVLHLRRDIFEQADYVSVGNAAAHASEFMTVQKGLAQLCQDKEWEVLHSGVWSKENKSLMMSELLAESAVAPDLIDAVYVPDSSILRKVTERASEIGCSPIHVVPYPDLFFEPGQTRKLKGTKIDIVDGDMFFSQKQTLTISVNTRGVMGAGLASRTKYAFPHVYVEYQDACKRRDLTVEKPFLLKEGYSFDEHMADDMGNLSHPNADRRFLLFATKDDWRHPSKIDYIRDGLMWLVKNAGELGIRSLAMPALGCGLGGLPWHRVGPLMCRHLRQLDIPCEVYLPRGNDRIPEAQLSEDFLLRE